MPLRWGGKAKQHFFLDVPITDVLHSVPPDAGKQSVGTKVLITIGPSCQDVDTLAQMLEAGVTCARIDLTWGTMEYHRRSLQNLNAAMQRTRRLCSVWLNTMGREMIVRRKIEYDESGWPNHVQEAVKAEKGQTVTITTDPTAEATASVYPINYPAFPALVEQGQLLQVGRYLATGSEGGSLFLEVKSKTEDSLVCEAQNSAVLDGLLTVMICHRSDNLDSRADLELPLLTQHDTNCIKTFGSEWEIDFIGLSYTNSSQDVYECRGLLDSLGMSQTKIVAKVERKAAIRDFGEILTAADGIIFSRGNLGLEFDAELMAMLQKRTISLCNNMGKPVILTRIVDTMVTTPRPTRAEATDVANAVLDGVDGVMLGAETLRGMYPLQTVETVLRLAHSAEEHFDYQKHFEVLSGEHFHYAEEEESFATLSPSLAIDWPDSANPYGVSPTYGGTSSSPNLVFQGDSARSAEGGGSPMFGPGSPPRGPGAPGPANGGSYLPPKPMSAAKYASSFGNLQLATGSLGPKRGGPSLEAARRSRATFSRVQKLDTLAASATRTAEKINAGLIVVMTQSGRTASLVAKYRPPMPVLAVVVPTLKSDGLSWRLEGKYLARQCLIIRGVVPMLAAPMTEGSDDLLSEAIYLATHQKLAKPGDYAVCILSHGGALAVKVVQVNKEGTGIRLMEEHANQLVTGDDADIIGTVNPKGVSGYVSCPGSMTPRWSPPINTEDNPFSFTGRGSRPLPMAQTSSDAHASLTLEALRGIPEAEGGLGEPGGIVSPSRDSATGSPQGGEKRPAAGGVLPMLGRRPSSVLAKYTGPGLPPLPLSNLEKARSSEFRSSDL